MTHGEALRDAARRLREAGSESPQRDARALLLDCANLGAAALISAEQDALPSAILDVFHAAIERRCAGEPVSRIIGRRDFYGAEFIVTPDVLDPRPESETIVDAAIETIGKLPHDNARILDLGTGSGCLLISILRHCPAASGIGLDRSQTALETAKRNAIALDVASRAEFLCSDWLEKVDETFDLVVCNPPYIGIDEISKLKREVAEWDPPEALFAANKGLDVYERLAPKLSSVLRKPGHGLFEVGQGQARLVQGIFACAGLGWGSLKKDDIGVERCVVVSINS